MIAVLTVRLLGLVLLVNGGQGLLWIVAGRTPIGPGILTYAASTLTAVGGAWMLISPRRLTAWLTASNPRRGAGVVLVGVAAIGILTGVRAGADAMWSLDELRHYHDARPEGVIPVFPGIEEDGVIPGDPPIIDFEDFPDGFPTDGFPEDPMSDEPATIGTSSGGVRALAPSIRATHDLYGDRRPVMLLNLGNSTLRFLVGLLLVFGRAPIARRLA